MMVKTSHQTIDIGMPVTKGAPSERVAIQPWLPIHWKKPVRMWPLKRLAVAGSGTSSRIYGICVRPVTARVRPTERPRRMKSEASVTMKEGRRVFTTMRPFR